MTDKTFKVRLRIKSLKPYYKPAPMSPSFPDLSRLKTPQDLLDKMRDAIAGPMPKPMTSCPECGLQFVDAMGRPISMGYACGNPRCPTGLGSPPSSQFRYAGLGVVTSWN
jgi:hypothetical protein